MSKLVIKVQYDYEHNLDLEIKNIEVDVVEDIVAGVLGSLHEATSRRIGEPVLFEENK